MRWNDAAGTGAAKGGQLGEGRGSRSVGLTFQGNKLDRGSWLG